LYSKKTLLARQEEIVETKASYTQNGYNKNRYSDNLSLHRKHTLFQGSFSATEKLSDDHLAHPYPFSVIVIV